MPRCTVFAPARVIADGLFSLPLDGDCLIINRCVINPMTRQPKIAIYCGKSFCVAKKLHALQNGASGAPQLDEQALARATSTAETARFPGIRSSAGPACRRGLQKGKGSHRGQPPQPAGVAASATQCRLSCQSQSANSPGQSSLALYWGFSGTRTMVSRSSGLGQVPLPSRLGRAASATA